jgi:ankyrin repeat and BTB/POZ domain-containing protein 1
LNDRIRNLLLQYDYSKSTDPLQPLAAHITSLLLREHPRTSDIVVTAADTSFLLHKFVLSSRSPYFQNKLSHAPETTTWRLPSTVPPQAFRIAIHYLYLDEVPRDLGAGPGTGFTETEVLAGIDKISKQLEIQSVFESILESGDRRLARQRRTAEVEKARDQLESWFHDNVIKYKVSIDSAKAGDVKWSRDNGIFADILLRADEEPEDDSDLPQDGASTQVDSNYLSLPGGIPVGPTSHPSRSPSRSRKPRKSILFPTHKAMLLRSEYFLAMFSSGFKEAQTTEHLQIVTVDCSPQVLEIVLTFLYTEKADFPLDVAVDVLFAADLLFIEKLKVKAAVVISTLGNGTMSQTRPPQAVEDQGKAPPDEQFNDEVINIYDVTRAAWDTRVQRLEEFAARYLAYRLELYIDDEDFADLIRESAKRITTRQETDSIELLDDIRYYLSERFRLRFEDSGLEDMMDEDAQQAELDEARGQSMDEGIDMNGTKDDASAGALPRPDGCLMSGGEIRTLDGDIAGDEFQSDAMNYQILLGKIDALLDRLKLDA